MNEIAIDGRKVVAARERVEQMLAHPHQRGGAAGREVEPTQQLLPPRLGGGVDTGRGGVRWARAPGLDRGGEPRVVGPEFRGEALEKGDPRAGGQLRVACQDLAGERHA